METHYNFPMPFQQGVLEPLTFSTSTIRDNRARGRSRYRECGCMLNSQSTASGKTVSI
jgi:hypothetical protein